MYLVLAESIALAGAANSVSLPPVADPGFVSVYKAVSGRPSAPTE